MRVNMVLDGEAKVLLEFMEMAIGYKVFQSFTVVEADLGPVTVTPQELPGMPEKKNGWHPRNKAPKFKNGDHVVVRHNSNADNLPRGTRGRVLESVAKGPGWRVKFEREGTAHAGNPIWIRESILDLRQPGE